MEDVLLEYRRAIDSLKSYMPEIGHRSSEPKIWKMVSHVDIKDICRMSDDVDGSIKAFVDLVAAIKKDIKECMEALNRGCTRKDAVDRLIAIIKVIENE